MTQAYALTAESPKMSDLLAEYVTLTAEKRSLEAQVDRLKSTLATQEEVLLDLFAEAGIQNIKTATGQTVYTNREVYAKLVGDQKKAHTALRRAGLGDLIKQTVSSQTLRAYVREMDEVLPKGLQPYIDVTEVYKMRMRSS